MRLLESVPISSSPYLQLAWASRDTFAASLRFHHLRVKELDMMRTIAANEAEQAEVFLRKAEWQIGELKHTLDVEGTGLLERSILSFGLCGREPSGGNDDEHASSLQVADVLKSAIPGRRLHTHATSCQVLLWCGFPLDAQAGSSTRLPPAHGYGAAQGFHLPTAMYRARLESSFCYHASLVNASPVNDCTGDIPRSLQHHVPEVTGDHRSGRSVIPPHDQGPDTTTPHIMPPHARTSTRVRRARGSSVPTPTVQTPFVDNSFAVPSQAISTWNPTHFDQPEPNPDINQGFTPGPYTVQDNPIPYFQSSLPLLTLPTLPSIARSISADQSYNAAPLMVWASIPHTAVLAHHQQQCGTSDIPSQVQHQVPGVNPYSGVSTPSTPTSCSQSQRDEQLEQVIKFASIALVNEMALNCDWRHKELSDAPIHAQQLWSDKINECIVMACVRFSHPQVDPLDTTAKRIVRSLSTFHSKMALMAESYGKKFLQVGTDAGQAPDFVVMQQRVAQITDPSIPGSFFLHQQNDAGEVERLFGHHILEEFHLDCWYTRDNSPVRIFKASYNTTTPNMLALSSVAGRCSNQGNTIKFSTETYVDHFNNYRDGILTGLRHPSFSQPLRHRLDWLNTQGKDQRLLKSFGLSLSLPPWL
ncbi:hypothetical protein L210DRAFT_3508208 [Boletus edulis BED1]|uniref:DUF6532 domain-containing protein n=1 Tax=Boletus edulis BED1 TaxID=1328754 RepID=A0AAD4G928_BOLED|nr:hypothetical protein L210DRAFT_3508208 [Boletus edulis BED1]